QVVVRRARRQERRGAAVADHLEMEVLVRGIGEDGSRFEDEIVFVGAQRAFVEPQYVATLIVKRNRLETVTGKRLLQRLADSGLRIARRCDTRARLHSHKLPRTERAESQNTKAIAVT